MPPIGFKLPTMESYDRTVDPIDHIEMFCTSMSIQKVDDTIMCKAFPATLKKAMRSWFSSLPPRSISTFKDLGEMFASHFISSVTHKKTSITLMSIHQRQDELLREFVTRFNNETLQVKDSDHTIAIAVFTNGVKNKDFTRSLTKKPPKAFLDPLLRVEKYINVERLWRSRPWQADQKGKGRKVPPKGKKSTPWPQSPVKKEESKNFSPLHAT